MGRRTPGDGALYKRKDGYWVGGVELPPDAEGKRRQKRIVRKNRNDVLAAIRDIKRDMAAGVLPASGTITVGKWLDYWQAEILPTRDVRPGTITSYRNTIRLYLTPRIGHLRMSRLNPVDIRNLYKEVRQAVSGRAAQKCDQVLRLAFKAAIRDGVLGVSVMDRVDKPTHVPKEGVSFPAATSMHIISTAVQTQGEVWGARWALGFVTGAREGEVLGLEWDRVDLDRGIMDVSWQLQRLPKAHGCGEPVDGLYPCQKQRPSYCPESRWELPPGLDWRPCKGTLVWTRPKTRAGTRLIPLIPEIREVLAGIRTPNPHGLVFVEPDGRPLAPDKDQKQWKQLLNDAGVPHAPQHSIRHSTATLLMEAKVDTHIVTSVIGHTDIATTRGYQHVNLELARQAWGHLSAMLPPVRRGSQSV